MQNKKRQITELLKISNLPKSIKNAILLNFENFNQNEVEEILSILRTNDLAFLLKKEHEKKVIIAKKLESIERIHEDFNRLISVAK